MTVQDFFKKHSYCSISGVAKISGINESLMRQYAAGLKKPRPAQRKKIETALHKLGEELIAIEL